MKELKEVNWRRSYKRRIGNEKLTLIRKNWGVRLIYDVYLRKGIAHILIGTCHVMEDKKFCPCGKGTESSPCELMGKGICPCKNSKFVVKELVSRSSELTKRLEDIQQLIRECL